MDPWSKGDYSQLIWEASMAVERLPVVILPSGRVTGRVLLVLPILKARWRRNRDEIAKKGSVLEGFGTRGKYMPKGSASRGPGGPGGHLARPGPGPCRQAAWSPGGPPPAALRLRGTFRNADFLYNFSGIFLAVYVTGKTEIQKQQKTETGTGVH